MVSFNPDKQPEYRVNNNTPQQNIQSVRNDDHRGFLRGNHLNTNDALMRLMQASCDLLAEMEPIKSEIDSLSKKEHLTEEQQSRLDSLNLQLNDLQGTYDYVKSAVKTIATKDNDVEFGLKGSTTQEKVQQDLIDRSIEFAEININLFNEKKGTGLVARTAFQNVIQAKNDINRNIEIVSRSIDNEQDDDKKQKLIETKEKLTAELEKINSFMDKYVESGLLEYNQG